MRFLDETKIASSAKTRLDGRQEKILRTMRTMAVDRVNPATLQDIHRWLTERGGAEWGIRRTLEALHTLRKLGKIEAHLPTHGHSYWWIPA